MDDVDLTILGGGPAGLFLGIAAASLLRSRVHLWTRQSYRDRGKTLEAVPVSLLVLLRQFGISPSDIGVSQVYRTREVAWSSIAPSLLSSSPFALIERPRFDRVLLRRLMSFANVDIHEAIGGEFEDATSCDDPSRVVVDATGRRAFMSAEVVRAPRQWVARLWSMECATPDERLSGLKLAALEGGYAYRLSSDTFTVVGLIGPDYRHLARVDQLRDLLESGATSWLLRGIQSAEVDSLAPRVASVQWSLSDDFRKPLFALGDAAVARDPIASQGIATSLSDGLYALTAIRKRVGPNRVRSHQSQQLAEHLKNLLHFIGICWSRASVPWRRYSEWLAGTNRSSVAAFALRDGEITEVF
jgi:flavin-dependent dehydrogenase